MLIILTGSGDTVKHLLTYLVWLFLFIFIWAPEVIRMTVARVPWG